MGFWPGSPVGTGVFAMIASISPALAPAPGTAGNGRSTVAWRLALTASVGVRPPTLLPLTCAAARNGSRPARLVTNSCALVRASISVRRRFESRSPELIACWFSRSSLFCSAVKPRAFSDSADSNACCLLSFHFSASMPICLMSLSMSPRSSVRASCVSRLPASEAALIRIWIAALISARSSV